VSIAERTDIGIKAFFVLLLNLYPSLAKARVWRGLSPTEEVCSGILSSLESMSHIDALDEMGTRRSIHLIDRLNAFGVDLNWDLERTHSHKLH